MIKKIIEWKIYLEEENGKKPKNINNFSIDSYNLPDISLVEQYLGKSKIVKEILNSKG